MQKNLRPAHRPRSMASERAILDATLRILMKGGYTALTIDRVATAARASKATIYRRWKTKEHLILAVFGQLPVAIPAKGASFEADLIALFGQFLKIMQASPLKGVLPMLAAECVDNPALSSALILINDQRRAPIRTVLDHAIQRGELAADTDLELVIDTIQGAIAVRMYFLLDTLNEAWIRKLARLLLSGIRKRK